MTLQLETPAEAIAAIATVVIAADNVTTFSERKLLFQSVQGLDVFEGYSPDDFRDLLVSVNNKVCDTLPHDGISLARDGINSICEVARDVLSPSHQEAAFRMAVELACADELVKAERELLDLLQQKLEIDDAVVEEIYRQYGVS